MPLQYDRLNAKLMEMWTKPYEEWEENKPKCNTKRRNKMIRIHKQISIDPNVELTSIPDSGSLAVDCPRIDDAKVLSRFCKDLCLCSITLRIDGDLKCFCADGKITEDIKGETR